MLTDRNLLQFLDELASSSPAPGGGSVAALAASMGAALTSMVCNLTIGKKKYADVQDEMSSVLLQSEQLRTELTRLIDKDTEAFNSVMAAFGLPKATEHEQAARALAIQEATKSATLVPLQVMDVCRKALRLAEVVAKKGNRNSLSDAGVAALMLQAGCAGAELNVRINLKGLSDVGFVQEISRQCATRMQEAEGVAQQILQEVNRSMS